MKKLLVFLCAIALVFTMAGSASAIPINFDVAGGNTTTVSATVTAHTAPVPEPSTVMLLGTGLIGMVTFGRKRFDKKA